jgi:hypothetical protein
VLSRRGAAIGLAILATGCASMGQSGGPTPVPSRVPPGVATCGVERWAVKTLADDDALRINFSPIATTVSALAGLPAHCGRGPDTSRPYAEELQVFEVRGRVTLVRLEDDHDYHVALVDPADGVSTIVVEVGDPTCAGPEAGLWSRQLIDGGRQSFAALAAGGASALVGQTVVVRGVGFYDVNHGQTGRSASCIELHPVLAIARSSP